MKRSSFRWLISGLVVVLSIQAWAESIVFPADMEVTNVKDFGAKGDGVTDDTDAIHRAILELRHGQTLYIPDGVYLVSRTIKFQGKSKYGNDINRLYVQGQSREGTIIRLKDRCDGFDSPDKPQPVIITKLGNESFRNRFMNFTVDVGRGNIGAIGIDYVSCNGGNIRDVTIRSTDPQGAGAAGIFIGHGDNAPCLVKNVSISGFDYGIKLESWFWAQVQFQNLDLEKQNKAGIWHSASSLGIHGLRSRNTVPAVVNRAVLSVVDAVLESRGGSAAIENSGVLFARNIEAPGYKMVLEESGKSVPGKRIDEYTSGPTEDLFPSPGRSLNLPVEQTPDVPWDAENNFANWVNVTKFGAKPGTESGDAIQKAVDSAAAAAKSTVYFPPGNYTVGKTVRVHGSVRRLIGNRASLSATEALSVKSRIVASGSTLPDRIADPVLRIEAGQPIVVIERISFGGNVWGTTVFVEHAAANTLVMKCGSGATYRNTVTGGKFFPDDWTLQMMIKGPQQVWASQLEQAEQLNDGGTLWILGIRNEPCGVILNNINGARTEVICGVTCDHKRPWVRPTFVNRDSQLSVAAYATGHPGFATDERFGWKRELLSDPFGRKIALFTCQPSADKTAPAAVRDLSAKTLPAQWPFQVQLSWNATADKDSGIVGYEVRRDGEQVGWTAEPTFIDSAMADSRQFTYEVIALNGGMLESTPATVQAKTAADTTPLQIASARGYDAKDAANAYVTFSKPVDPAAAQLASNYQLEGADVTAAKLEKDGRTVVLTLNRAPANAPWQLTTKGIQDTAAEANRLDSATASVVPVEPGDGLLLEVFNNKDFQGQPQTRRIRAIDLQWQGLPVLPELKAGQPLSLRITGFLRGPRSEAYHFTTENSGPVRIWIDGEEQDEAALLAGRLHPIRVEYVPEGNDAKLRLFWLTADDDEKRIVPDAHYYPPADLPLEVNLVAAWGSNPETVSVIYSRAVEADSAANPANYRLDNGAKVVSARMEPDGRTALLEVRGLRGDASNSLSIANVIAREGAGQNASPLNARVPFTPGPVGDGLTGTYRTNVHRPQADKTVRRVDPQVDFDWPSAPPFENFPKRHFAVEWRGWLRVDHSGEYRFIGNPATWDAYHLWIDGRQVMLFKRWEDKPIDATGTVYLEAGRLVPFLFSFADARWTNQSDTGARAQLYWEGPGITRQLIPQDHLYTEAPNPPR